jgi:hypothetical protein
LDCRRVIPMVNSPGSKTGPFLLVKAGEIGCKSETLEKRSWGCHVLMRLAYIDLARDDISNMLMFSRGKGVLRDQPLSASIFECQSLQHHPARVGDEQGANSARPAFRLNIRTRRPNVTEASCIVLTRRGLCGVGSWSWFVPIYKYRYHRYTIEHGVHRQHVSGIIPQCLSSLYFSFFLDSSRPFCP